MLDHPLSRRIAKIVTSVGFFLILIVFLALSNNVISKTSMKSVEIDNILSQITTANSRDYEILNEQKQILHSHDTFLDSLYKSMKNIEKNITK